MMQCRKDEDCPSGAFPLCSKDKLCSQCLVDQDCDPQNPICRNGECISCIDNGDCFQQNAVCSGGTCTTCVSDSNCNERNPFCFVTATSSQCVEVSFSLYEKSFFTLLLCKNSTNTVLMNRSA